MTEQEHLQKIKARCEALLEGAKMRTPGEWNAFHAHSSICVGVNQQCESVEDLEKLTHIEVFGAGNRENDAAFIASCAGAAEAGWKATIAAIDGLLLIAEHGNEPERGAAKYDLQKIRAAWPEGIL